MNIDQNVIITDIEFGVQSMLDCEGKLTNLFSYKGGLLIADKPIEELSNSLNKYSFLGRKGIF